jgi:hypothetical protein
MAAQVAYEIHRDDSLDETPSAAFALETIGIATGDDDLHRKVR